MTINYTFSFVSSCQFVLRLRRIRVIEVVSKPQIVFKGKASIRFKSGAYTLVREHFKSNRNAASGRKMHF